MIDLSIFSGGVSTSSATTQDDEDTVVPLLEQRKWEIFSQKLTCTSQHAASERTMTNCDNQMVAVGGRGGRLDNSS